MILRTSFEQAFTGKLAVLEFAEICDLQHFAPNFLHFLEIAHAFSLAVTKVALIDITICVYVNGVAMIEILLEATIVLLTILFLIFAYPFFNELSFALSSVIFEPAFEVVHEMLFARLYLAIPLSEIILEWSSINIVIVIDYTILVMLFTVFQSPYIFLPILLVDCHFLSVAILTIIYLKQQVDVVCDPKVFLIAEPIPNLEVMSLRHVADEELGIKQVLLLLVHIKDPILLLSNVGFTFIKLAILSCKDTFDFRFSNFDPLFH